MLQWQQVHSQNRAKTKKAKTCLMVTKAHTSEDKVKKYTFISPSDTFQSPSDTFPRPSENFLRPSDTFLRPS